MKLDMSRGVIYCATTNKKYLFMAVVSGLQFIALNPKVQITIITDLTIGKFLSKQLRSVGIEILFKKMGRTDSINSNYGGKTNIYNLSPYKNTLYLDADIIPLKNCDELWRHSKNGQIGLVLGAKSTLADVTLHKIPEITYTRDLVPANFPNYDTAIILYSKSNLTQRFFEEWFNEWNIYKNIDHYALMRSVYKTSIPIIQLPVKYNTYIDNIRDNNYFQVTFLHLAKEIIDWRKTVQVIITLAPESYILTKSIFNYSDLEILQLS
jgi:hypothetical protein